jgi:hypothetical protein
MMNNCCERSRAGTALQAGGVYWIAGSRDAVLSTNLLRDYYKINNLYHYRLFKISPEVRLMTTTKLQIDENTTIEAEHQTMPLVAKTEVAEMRRMIELICPFLSISLYDDFYVTVEVVVKLYEQVHGKVAS